MHGSTSYPIMDLDIAVALRVHLVAYSTVLQLLRYFLKLQFKICTHYYKISVKTWAYIRGFTGWVTLNKLPTFSLCNYMRNTKKLNFLDRFQWKPPKTYPPPQIFFPGYTLVKNKLNET